MFLDALKSVVVRLVGVALQSAIYAALAIIGMNRPVGTSLLMYSTLGDKLLCKCE